MQIYRLTAVLSACWFVSTASFADTLTFIAQPISGGGIDYSWFTAANWFTTDTTGNLLPAGRIPLENEAAMIIGTVDLQTMIETNNASVTNGTVAVENLQLFSGSSLISATVNVLSGLVVGGTNCVLNATTLNILAIGAGIFQPIPPAKASTLILTNGAALVNSGSLGLTDGSQISAGGLPQNKLVIQTGAMLASTNSAVIRGSTNGHLIIDNSGTVRADGVALTFTDGIDWQCSSGLQEFRTTAPSALILFSNLFHTDSLVTSLFTGPGTNRWVAGATIDGTAQIGVLDPGTQLAGPGNLEMLSSVTGVGIVHVLGTTNQGGVGTWINGALGVPALTIDSGASLVIGGGLGTSRQIAGCVITNLGICTLLNGDLGFSQGAIFDNQSGATFVVKGDGVFSSAGTSEAFNNSGIFQKLSPGTIQFGSTNSTPGPAFNNSGLVDLESGELNLVRGVSSGEFRQAPGTLLWFWGGAHSATIGSSFTGSSMIRVAQGNAPATLVAGDALTLSQLELGANGTLDASGAPDGIPILIGELLAHDNGVLSNGTFQVQSCQMLDQCDIALSVVTIGSTLAIGGTNCSLSGTLLNLATGAVGILQSSGVAGVVTLNLAQSSILQIGGQLTMTDGSVIAGEGLPQGKLIVQTGGMLVCTNSTAGGISAVAVDFNNSGKLEVQSGILNFQGSWNQTQGATIIGAGALLSGTNVTVLGGTITGSGTISAKLINAGGLVSPGVGIGVLSTSPGNDYQQNAPGSLAVGLGGTAPGSQYDQFAVGGTAYLDGQLQVTFNNGFVPQPGQAFEILTCNSEVGKFAGFVAPPLAGLSWVTRYNATNVTLLLAENVSFGHPSVSGGTLSLPVNTTPGVVYVVQATDSLGAPQWQTISTFTGDGTVKMASDTADKLQRFYRVTLQ